MAASSAASLDRAEAFAPDPRLSVDSFAFYSEGPYQRYMSGVVRLTQGLTIRRGQWPAGDFPDPQLNQFNLQMAAGTAHQRFEADMGAGRFAHIFRPGDFHFAPYGTACHYVSDGAVDTISLDIAPSAVSIALDENGTGSRQFDFGRLHAHAFRDPFIEACVHRLWREAATSTPADPLLADSIGNAIVHALGSACRVRQVPCPTSASRLSSPQLAAAQAYVEDRLAQAIRLDAWAAHLRLPLARFTLAFRETTGITPYQYVMRRRVEAAGVLIRTTTRSLCDIALEAGFANQSHMTRIMKQNLGVTPGMLRSGRDIN